MDIFATDAQIKMRRSIFSKFKICGEESPKVRKSESPFPSYLYKQVKGAFAFKICPSVAKPSKRSLPALAGQAILRDDKALERL